MKHQTMLKMLSIAVVAVSLIAVLPPPAGAHHRPQSHCSESGDICQSVVKVNGVRKLRITTSARFFGRYVLCVRGPLDYDSCRHFRMAKRSDGDFADAVRFGRHFGDRPGRYTVTWYRVPKYGPPKKRIGVRLGFHV